MHGLTGNKVYRWFKFKGITILAYMYKWNCKSICCDYDKLIKIKILTSD